ncbi:MAG TPA: hypothetical protein VGM57_05570 [Pseudolabrys sp.]
MKLTVRLIAAAALVVSVAAPAFAIEPLSQQLEERNTYTNPSQTTWAASAMEMRTHPAPMHMQGPAWRTQTNVSPASMDSGLEQQR